MSIFKESFQPYVDLQLKIREAILKHGNTKSRFGSPNLFRTKKSFSKTVTKKVKIKQGAFYTNTVERQCTIRMASGVDIDGSSNVAKTFILEGGVPKKGTNIPRDGFVHGNRKGNAYGSPEMFADAGDDFGIVPMPGIVDANIRTKSAYGSLREAQVNFVCHNRRQLEVLERLYMRPGFPLLVEWQWTPYVDNDGNIQKRAQTLSSKMGMFWKKTSTFEAMQKQIHKLKAQTGGNYDGFIGICKNFDFKATPAGGYECTTEIISTGEILDGLKGKRDGYKLKTTEFTEDKYGRTVEGEGEEKELDNFEYILESIKQYSEVYNLQEAGTQGEGKGTLDSSKIFIANASLFRAFQNLADSIDPSSNKIMEFVDDEQLQKIQDEERSAQTSDMVKEAKENKRKRSNRKGKYFQNSRAKARTEEGKEFIDEISRIEELLDKFIIRKGELVTIDANESVVNYKVDGITQGSPHTYIRWDFLAHIINTQVLEEYKKNENIAEITWSRKIPGTENKYEYLDYVDNSVDPLVDIPMSLNANGEGINHFPLSSILGISLDPTKCLLPHQMNKFMLNKSKEFENTVISRGDGATAGDFSIGYTFFNVTYLLQLYANMRYNEDGSLNKNFKLLNFFKKLWEEDVNGACAGSHNFLVHHDKENTSHVRVIDLMFQSDGLQPEDLYKFNIQDTNSIVRDFNFNSTIPSALSSTMAIVAQDPRSIGDVESVTANALNKDLTSRFSEFSTAYDYTEENIEARKDKEIEVIKAARFLRKYNVNILTGYYNTLMGQMENVKESGTPKIVDFTSLQQAMKNYKKLEDLISWLQTRYPLTNEKEEPFEINGVVVAGALRKEIKSTKSEIIPLKFSCLLDGIGGIIIGNVFKVDKKRLPIGYQGDDIAFIVHAESQTITSGQDWTTEISGQLVLLDIPRPEEEKTGVIISPGDVAIQGSDIEGDNTPTPNADMLREALKHFGYREKDNPNYNTGIHAQLSTFGDIGFEIKTYMISILYKISNCFLRLPKEQRPIIMITGGNDRKSKTRHTQGNAVDFKIDKFYDPVSEKLIKTRPAYEEIYGNISEQKKILHNKDFVNADLEKLGFSAEGNDFETNFEDNVTKRALDNIIATVDSILKGFVGASSAEGRLRYLNEYNYPTKHSTGPHFHVSYGLPDAGEGGPKGFTNKSAPQNYTGRKQEGGVDNLTLAQRTVSEKSLVFYRDKFTTIVGYQTIPLLRIAAGDTTINWPQAFPPDNIDESTNQKGYYS